MEPSTIGPKELFERIVRLETLMVEKNKLDSHTTKMFQFLAFLIIVIGVANVFVHIYRM